MNDQQPTVVGDKAQKMVDAKKAALVCVIDDNDSVRVSLARLLRAKRYEVAEFKSAQEFLATGVAPSARCLVVDFGLPGMNGMEMVRELADRGLKIPTIVTSGLCSEQLLDEIDQIEYARFMEKPLEIAKLFEAVEACLN